MGKSKKTNEPDLPKEVPIKEVKRRDKIADALKGKAGQTCFIQGWVRTKSDFKERTFIKVNDGSCLQLLQIVAEPLLENYSEIVRLTTGSSIAVEGTLIASVGKEQELELKASKVTIIGTCDGESYPIRKQGLPFEYLRENAHLRTRTNTFGAVARVRNVLAFAIHRFFQERGFLYVHTPIITASDTEGAGAMFQVTTLPLEKLPKIEDQINYKEDFFGKKSYLTVSGQLNVETFCCALGDVYTFGPTFRAENSNTTRHLAEFWMVEPEIAFCDIFADMDLAESFIKYLIQEVIEKCPNDLDFFEDKIQKGLIETLTHVQKAGFVRITYTEAIDILMKSKKKFEYPVSWGIDMQSEHERFLCESEFKQPVIVRNFPRKIKAFYMRVNEDLNTVAAMDILVPRIGEIIGGSQREERLPQLEEQLQFHHLDRAPYEWYLDLRRYGTIPHAGFGLGFDRFVQYVTGMANIRDVAPFPRTPGQASF
ncbi:MAG: asparagine--tRNA ligase [Planctomycetota bacterium]